MIPSCGFVQTWRSGAPVHLISHKSFSHAIPAFQGDRPAANGRVRTTTWRSCPVQLQVCTSPCQTRTCTVTALWECPQKCTRFHIASFAPHNPGYTRSRLAMRWYATRDPTANALVGLTRQPGVVTPRARALHARHFSHASTAFLAGLGRRRPVAHGGDHNRRGDNTHNTTRLALTVSIFFTTCKFPFSCYSGRYRGVPLLYPPPLPPPLPYFPLHL